jgi:hypothetical protein
MKLKVIFNKKGQIAILVTLLFLTVILAVSVGLIALTVREIKMARNVKESAQAIAAADAGMDYILANMSAVGHRCEEDDWQDLLGGESGYCTRFVMFTPTEGGYSSIGRSGSVRRAVFSPAVESLDQSATLSGEHTGQDVCRCHAVHFGPGLGFVAQTFMAGRDGELFAARAHLSSDPLSNFNTANLRAEIWDAVPYPDEEFYPSAAKPGSIVLASTTVFTLGEIEDTGCKPPNTCRYIVFNFDPPLSVTAGTNYTLVLQDPAPSDNVRAGACCTERRYFPGKGWRLSGGDWEDTFDGFGFDLAFGIYILTPPGGEYSETKP